MKIFTFDTTLRDGTQGEAVSFSVDDKLAIAQKLDELGIDYIEGGWPGSNPKDKEFFARARELKLKHARLTAFGSTRFAKNPVEQDPNVRALRRGRHAGRSPSSARAGTCTPRARSASPRKRTSSSSPKPCATSRSTARKWSTTPSTSSTATSPTPTFALRTLEAAKNAGADVLCLCDTNGGTLTGRLVEIVAEVRKRFDGVLGIHCPQRFRRGGGQHRGRRRSRAPRTCRAA